MWVMRVTAGHKLALSGIDLKVGSVIEVMWVMQMIHLPLLMTLMCLGKKSSKDKDKSES